MTYNEITEVLAKTDTHEARIARVVNHKLSKSGIPSLMVPPDLFKFVSMGNPAWGFILVQFVSPTEIKRGICDLIMREHWSYSKPVFGSVGSLRAEGNLVYRTRHDTGDEICVGSFGNEEIVPFIWPEKVSKTTQEKSKPVKAEAGSLLVAEAQTLIMEGINALTLNMTSPISHGNVKVDKYSFVQTFSEYCQAYGLNNYTTGDVYLPTHLRATGLLPYPWGGISDVKKKDGFSEADRINMGGEDIGKFKWNIPNIHVKRPLKSYERLDSKLIASVGEPAFGIGRYTDVPVEAFWEIGSGETASYDYEAKSLWTWVDEDVAIGFIIRNHNYIVPKAKLQEAVRKRVKVFQTTKESTSGLRGNRDAYRGKRKWCAWFSVDEIESMSILDFPMPPIYGEMLEKYAPELLELYADKDKGEDYTNRQLRFFHPNL